MPLDVAARARPAGTERNPWALGAVETAVATFLIVAASSHAVRFALAMVPTSLAHDELLSVAVAGLLAVLAVWSWRSGRRLEAAALVGVFAGNPLLLGLWLSVCGYGLLALWAALGTVHAIEWGRSNRPATSIACVL